MKNSVVSVIIPIYKVEPYIHKCIDSVLSQSYGNLDIVLVDDGSPDMCGSICDEYARLDSRISVIHKANGGLSDARNVGLKYASGQYITFLDSDDWWKTDFIKNSIILQEAYDADIVAFPLCKVDTRGRIINKAKKYSYVIRSFDSSQAMESMFAPDGIPWCAQAKIYKKELFDDLTDPVGLLMEDKATTYKVFHKCKRIIYADYSDYMYLIRKGSIMHSPFNAKKAQSFNVQLELNSFIELNYPSLVSISSAYTSRVALSLLCSMISSNYQDEGFTNVLLDYWIKNKQLMYSSSVIDKRYKLLSRVSSFFYSIYGPKFIHSPSFKLLCTIVSIKLNN